MSRFSNILLASSSSSPTKAQSAAYLHASDVIMHVMRDSGCLSSTSDLTSTDLLGEQNFYVGLNSAGVQGPDIQGTAGTDAFIKFVGTQDFMTVDEDEVGTPYQNGEYLVSMHKADAAWTFVIALKLASVTEQQGVFLSNLVRWGGSTYGHGVEIEMKPNEWVRVGVGNGASYEATVTGAVHSTVNDQILLGVSVDVNTRAVTVRTGSTKYTGSLPAFTPSTIDGGYGAILGGSSKTSPLAIQDLSTNTEMYLFGIIDKVVTDSEWTTIISNAESLTGVTFDNV